MSKRSRKYYLYRNGLAGSIFFCLALLGGYVMFLVADEPRAAKIALFSAAVWVLVGTVHALLLWRLAKKENRNA